MFPFFEIFGRQIPTFGLMGILGVAIAVYVASFRAKRYNLTRFDVVNIAVTAGIGLMIGSAIMFAIVNIPRIPYFWESAMVEEFGGDGGFRGFYEFISRLFGGMVFYGGLFGAFIALILHCRRAKRPFGDVLALTIPVFPLAHAFMRLGCFLAGCCFGMESERFGIAINRVVNNAGVRRVVDNGVRIPVQLYESAANLVIFAIIWMFTRKERNWKTIVGMYGMMYSVVRFCLEFLRGDTARGIWQLGMSTSQWISVGVFALCAMLLVYDRVKLKREL